MNDHPAAVHVTENVYGNRATACNLRVSYYTLTGGKCGGYHATKAGEELQRLIDGKRE